VAVDLITQHVRTKLGQSDLTRIYQNLHVMPATMQTRGMHTVIRSRATSREDFVFYADRLIRLVVEHALGILPFKEQTVTTPSGEPYVGVSFSRRLCGVSIIRSGEAMENALRACCAGVRIGKILCQNHADGEVLYEKLPHDIAERHVLVMDPICGAGHSAKNTIEALIKCRNVKEERIILLSLLAAPDGIRRVCSAFPKLKVITSEIDECLGSDGKVRPGVGEFGDRYFGTTSPSDEGMIRQKGRQAWMQQHTNGAQASGSPTTSSPTDRSPSPSVMNESRTSTRALLKHESG